MADERSIADRLGALRAFLFDFDGTLVRQRVDFGLMRTRVREVLTAHGVPLGPLEGLYVLEMVERARRELAAGDGDRAEALAREARVAIEEVELLGAEEAEALPGAAELLSELRGRGVGIGIVTRNCRVAVERVLARQPLAHDVLLTRDDVRHVKPDPSHLLTALEMLGVDGAQAAMCGDHPMDITAGHRVGALTVGVLADGADEEFFAEVRPELLVRGVGELRGYLGRSEHAPSKAPRGCGHE